MDTITITKSKYNRLMITTKSELFNQELKYYFEDECLVLRQVEIDDEEYIVNPKRYTGKKHFTFNVMTSFDWVKPKNYTIDEDSTKEKIIIYLKQ